MPRSVLRLQLRERCIRFEKMDHDPTTALVVRVHFGQNDRRHDAVKAQHVATKRRGNVGVSDEQQLGRQRRDTGISKLRAESERRRARNEKNKSSEKRSEKRSAFVAKIQSISNTRRARRALERDARGAPGQSATHGARRAESTRPLRRQSCATARALANANANANARVSAARSKSPRAASRPDCL